MRFVRISVLLLTCCLVMAAASPSGKEGKPRLAIKAINPPPGAVVDGSTVLKVTLDYSVGQAIGERDHYYVFPIFVATDPRQLFSGLKQLNEGLPLKEPTGTVEYVYPIAKEWSDPRLGKPVVVTFTLIKQSGDEYPDNVAWTERVKYEMPPK
jgi:hypothetical protein